MGSFIEHVGGLDYVIGRSTNLCVCSSTIEPFPSMRMYPSFKSQKKNAANPCYSIEFLEEVDHILRPHI